MPISFGSGAGQFPIIINPGQQRLIFAIEDASLGTPTLTNTKTFMEACSAITTAIQRTPFDANEYAGVPATLFDMIETTHHTTITITCPFRANGIAAWALAALMGSSLGGATDTATQPTVAWPPTTPLTGVDHYIQPNNGNNICSTFTIWHDQGDANANNATLFPGQRGLLQISACTVESVRLTFTPNTAVQAEITLQGRFPKWRGVSGSTGSQNAPISNFIRLTDELNAQSGTTWRNTRMMGFQAPFFNIMSSTSGTTYTNKILSGDLTVTRTVEVIESPYSQDPTFLLPAPLTVTGTINGLYDGLGQLDATNNTANNVVSLTDPNFGAPNTNTIYQDYLAFKRTGQQTAPNNIRYLDSDNFGFEIGFWPIKWTSFGITSTANSLQFNAGFTSFNDLSLASPATGSSKISAVQYFYVKNQVVAGGMLA